MISLKKNGNARNEYLTSPDHRINHQMHRLLGSLAVRDTAFHKLAVIAHIELRWGGSRLTSTTENPDVEFESSHHIHPSLSDTLPSSNCSGGPCGPTGQLVRLHALRRIHPGGWFWNGTLNVRVMANRPDSTFHALPYLVPSYYIAAV